MSIELPMSSPIDDTPYSTLLDDEGNVVVPDSIDGYGEQFDYIRVDEKHRYRRKALGASAQLALDFNEGLVDGVPEVVVGPSVRLDDRHDTLSDMKQRYADYAQAIGLRKAAESESERPRLKSKIANLDLRVKQKLAQTKYTQSKEKETLSPILKTNELIAAGFRDVEVELAEQETIHSIRNAFGHTVGHKERTKNMKQVNPGRTPTQK